MRELVDTVMAEELERAGGRLPYTVGTMIELPRAAVCADQIAAHADFFSFGTNDLTQTAIGISRDDAEGAFLAAYIDERILRANPFALDRRRRRRRAGADRLPSKGRSVKPDLKLGVCGEHGGDPASIAFFHADRAGLRVLLAVPGADRPVRRRPRHPRRRAGGRFRVLTPAGCGSGRRVPRGPAGPVAASTAAARRVPADGVGMGHGTATARPDRPPGLGHRSRHLAARRRLGVGRPGRGDGGARRRRRPPASPSSTPPTSTATAAASS